MLPAVQRGAGGSGSGHSARLRRPTPGPAADCSRGSRGKRGDASAAGARTAAARGTRTAGAGARAPRGSLPGDPGPDLAEATRPERVGGGVAQRTVSPSSPGAETKQVEKRTYCLLFI